MAFSKYLNHQGIDIARGLIVDTSHINKFGFTGSNANGTATVWDGNGTTAVYPYPVAGIVSVSSSSGTDDGETIEVQGLDDQFNAVTETLTVGSGTSTASFSRVFRARMITAVNVGTISIDQGVNLAAQIFPNNGQTLMAVYTIPAGYTGYIAQFQGSVDKANVDVKFKLLCREPNDNGVFRLIGQWGTQGGNPVGYEYPVPLRAPEKSDLRVDVTTGAASGCGAIFDVILIKN